MKVPRRVRVAVAVAAGSGSATMVAAVVVARGQGLGPLPELAAFTTLLGLNWAFPLFVLHRDETEAFQLDEAFFVAMALLLPPLGTIAAFATAAVLSQMVLRRPRARVAFNAGVTVAAAGTSLAVVHLAARAGGPLTAAQVGAAVVGAGVFLLVNSGATSGIIALAEERPFWAVWADGIGFNLLVWCASVAIGLLAALAGSAYPWALLLAALPMGVLQVVLAGSLRARRDRERIDGLLRAALEAHASMRVEDVEEALTTSAEELLQCRDARLDERPPAPDELGSRLDASGVERWLVVSGRRSVEPFTARDAKLLDTIAAVGAGAMENAHLVDRIRHQAFHDALTGLPNQLLFEERVLHALDVARRSREHVAVLVVDLDRFKKVNDTLGHGAGNDLLREVAARLTEQLRAGDTAARFGGDEFTVLLTGVREAADAIVAAERILEACRRPFRLGRRDVVVTASIGIALSSDGGRGPAALLKNADAAMFRAKERGRNGCRLYAPGMRTAASHLTLEADLHKALRREELHLLYQPQVDMRSGRIAGVEALVRWPHPTMGLVTPDRFIPIAEDTGLILQLDAWVLRAACTQARVWSDGGLPPIRVAVNLSAREFQHDHLVETVTAVLDGTGLDADRLELEITESVAGGQAGDATPMLAQLRRLGVQLAIDDFGTGYSMLSRLRDFPLDRLKIDKSFVDEIDGPDADAPIVAALIAMAHSLRLQVTAEGVETPHQRTFLERHRCDEMQGYLFSRPVESDQITALLARRSVGERRVPAVLRVDGDGVLRGPAGSGPRSCRHDLAGADPVDIRRAKG